MRPWEGDGAAVGIPDGLKAEGCLSTELPAAETGPLSSLLPASSVITRDPSQFPEACLDKEPRPLPFPFPVPHKIKSQVTHYPKITYPLGNTITSNKNIDLTLVASSVRPAVASSRDYQAVLQP